MSERGSGNRRRSGSKPGAGSGATRFTGRGRFERVRTAKGRKGSSTRWLQRQLNDPYVAEARARGLRSRAAFKLLEIDDKLHLLKPGARVVDLGAAPGGWTQVAVGAVNALGTGSGPQGQVVGLDLQEMEDVAGAVLLCRDFMEEETPEELKKMLGGQADLVMSDMAAPATGHPGTDHLRIIGLCEAAYQFALETLAPDGAFLAKVLQGGAEGGLLTRMKRDFETVKHVKPPASRKESPEMYVVALGFRHR